MSENITARANAADRCLVLREKKANGMEWELHLYEPENTSYPTAKSPSPPNWHRQERYLHHGYGEVFFPKVPVPNPLYEVTLTGTLRWQHGKIERLWGDADALYRGDRGDRFSCRHDWLLVNGKRLDEHVHEMLDVDRGDHEYRFLIDGHPGERLAFTFEPDLGEDYAFTGYLAVSVFLFPADTPTLAQREDAEEAAPKTSADAFSKECLAIRRDVERNAEIGSAIAQGADELRAKWAELNLPADAIEERVEEWTKEQITKYFPREERRRGKLIG